MTPLLCFMSGVIVGLIIDFLVRLILRRHDQDADALPDKPHPSARRNRANTGWELDTLFWPDQPRKPPHGPPPPPPSTPSTVQPPIPEEPPPKRGDYLNERDYRDDLKAYLKTGKRETFWPERTIYSDTTRLERQAEIMHAKAEQQRRDAELSQAEKAEKAENTQRKQRAAYVLRRIRYGIASKRQRDLHEAFTKREDYLKLMRDSADQMTADMYQGMLEAESNDFLTALAETYGDPPDFSQRSPTPAAPSLCIPHEPPEAESYSIEYESGQSVPISKAEFEATGRGRYSYAPPPVLDFEGDS